jgi:hypothetical protein
MRKLWIPLVVLVLAALACSLPGGGNPTPAQQAEATQAPSSDEEATAVSPTSESGDEAAQIDSAALSNLSSYRVRWSMQWTPEGGTAESTVILQEHTREPQAYRITMEGGQGSIEMVQIEGTTWTCFGGSCAQTQASEDDIASQFDAQVLDPSDLTSDSDMDYVGQETVNGISTRHYTLNLNAAGVALLGQGEVTDVNSAVWIADDASLPAFVVRYTMTWQETRDGQAGANEISYEVYDVNAPFTIEPPENAASMPEDIPAYPDAATLMVMEGLVSFSTSDDVATVADFYRAELPNLGWTGQSDDVQAALVMQTWVKDAQTMTLMITEGEEGTSVMITLE